MNWRSLIFYIIIVIGITVSAFVFENHKQMSPVFTVPFFSGAANYSYERGWHFYPQDFWDYKFLPVEAKENFRFTTVPDSSLQAYKHYNSGYIYIILLAKKLFFWLGDIKAVKFFQILSHILISIMVCSKLKNRLGQVGFVCVYALNPLVIYFVTFLKKNRCDA